MSRRTTSSRAPVCRSAFTRRGPKAVAMVGKSADGEPKFADEPRNGASLWFALPNPPGFPGSNHSGCPCLSSSRKPANRASFLKT